MAESRRHFIKRIVRGGFVVVTYPILTSRLLYADVDPTPEETAGPYYKKGAPIKDRLVESGDEAATALIVSGLIINPDETPVPDAKIEVWHANHDGEYDLDGYRYRAQIALNKDAKYRFSTVMPGNYGGRARHIHYMITAPRHRTLITQLYFENDPLFEGNPRKNFSKDPIVRYPELIQPVKGSSVYFRICLQPS